MVHLKSCDRRRNLGKVAAAVGGMLALTTAAFGQVFHASAPDIYPTASVKPEDFTEADFDGDGVLDLAIGNTYHATLPEDGNLTVYLGNAHGAFGAPSYIETGIRPEGVTSADFDGDGAIDIATANLGDSTVTLLFGLGDGTFTTDGFVLPDTARHINSADFNEDGAVDLVTAGYDAGAVSVWTGAGDGTFVHGETYAAGAGTETVTLANANGDSHVDLFVTNDATNDVVILHGVGDGTFLDVASVPMGSRPRYTHAVDLDGDGLDDFLTSNWDDDNVYVVRNNGGASYTRVDTLSAAGGKRAIYPNVGDLNNDGFPDVTVSFFKSDFVAIFPGLGGFSFGVPQIMATGDSPYTTGIRDYDADGLTDLLVVNVNAPNMHLYFGQPAGSVAPAIVSATATPPVITDTETSFLEVVASDADGGPSTLTYFWHVPAGAGAVDDPTLATPLYFAPDVVGGQTFTLTVDVTDGESVVSEDVIVHVDDADAPQLVLAEDFEDGDLSGWTAVDEGTNNGPSDWVAEGGDLLQNSNISSSSSELARQGTYLRCEAGNAWTDYRASVRMSTGDNDTMGFMVRIQDAENFYRFSWDRQRSVRRLVRCSGGVFTLLAEDSVQYERHQVYHVEVTVEGTSLEVRVDGALVFAVNDSAVNGGTIGLHTWSCRPTSFDDVFVEDLGFGNAAPSIAQLTATPTTLTDGETSFLEVVATDGDLPLDETLSYSWSVLDGAGTFDDAGSSTATFFPADVTSTQVVLVRVSVSDGTDATTQTLSLVVSDADAQDALLAADFNQGSLAGWSVVNEAGGSSDWSIVGGELLQHTNLAGGDSAGSSLPKPGTYLRYDAGTFWENYRVRVALSTADNDALGVLFRLQDANNFYRFSWDRQRNYRRLVKCSGGQFSLLAEDSVVYNRDQTYQVELTADGATLELRIDGAAIFSVTDVSIPAGTVALYTWGCRPSYFDDVTVTDLGSGGGLSDPTQQAPQITSVTAAPASLLETTTSQLTVVASDADNQPGALTYSWSVPAGAGSVDDPTSATPTYLPSNVSGTQSFELSVTVSDGQDAVSETVTVTVIDAAVPTTELLRADFSSADLSGWTVVDQGTARGPSMWSVDSGELVQSTNIYSASTDLAELSHLGTHLKYNAGASWGDYRLSLSLRTSDDDSMGFLFRVEDSDHYYRFSWDRQRQHRRIVKCDGGVFTVLAEDSVPFNRDQAYQVELTAQGASLELRVDGAVVFAVSDATHTSGTVALYTWNCRPVRFDNVVVEEL